MTKWEYFLWLVEQAAGVFLFLWPVAAGLLGLLAFAIFSSRAKRPFTVKGGWTLQLCPVFVPIAVLALGAAYACENCSPSSLGQGVRHVWAMNTVNVLFLVNVIGGVVLIKLARGMQLVSAALQLIQFWITLCSLFVAGMSLSGDWI